MNLRFLSIKFLRALVTLWLVVTFVFVILRLSGDPAEQLLPDDVAPEIIEFYRKQWGLDRPIWEQYVKYFQAMAEGNFGRSFGDRREALVVISERIPYTLQLGLTVFITAMLLGIPSGIYAALHRNSAADRITMSFAVLGYSMPNFFLGILLIFLFSLKLRWLPSSGAGTPWHMVMPVITLGTALAGSIARFSRSAMLEVMNQDYIRTARSKGVRRLKRIYVHALPNAAIPIVTVVGFKLGALIGGAVVTENVFAWPGVGRLLVNAVGNRDLAVVQGIVMLIAATMLVANLLVDIAYGWLDPRIRVAGDDTGR
ncbi:MAG: ABC transporter permease [Acetobacterales bacterium]